MATPNNHRVVDSAEAWMRQQEKKLMHQERRPNITKASDLMGPSLGPHAVEIVNWRGDESNFNGFVYSRPGAIDAPDDVNWWLGQVITQIEGFGIQQAWDYRGTSVPMTMMTRRITLVGGQRVFGAWA